MVMNGNFNNTACYALGAPAYSGCHSAANTCQDISESITYALTPLAYTLLTMGGVFALDGLVKTIDIGYDAVACCVHRTVQKRVRDGYINTRGIEDDTFSTLHCYTAEKPPVSGWKKVVGTWNSIFKTTKALGYAALFASIGIPLYELTNIVQDSCAEVANSCPEFRAALIDDCNWANQWMIDVIKELLKSSSP